MAIDYAREVDYGAVRDEWMDNTVELGIMDWRVFKQIYTKENGWKEFVSSPLNMLMDGFFNEDQKKLVMRFNGYPGFEFGYAVELNGMNDETDAWFKLISIISVVSLQTRKAVKERFTVTGLANEYKEDCVWARNYSKQLEEQK